MAIVFFWERGGGQKGGEERERERDSERERVREIEGGR